MNDARDLTKRLAELLRREHGTMADFLIALADFDRGRCWIELGYTSLFHFLHRELGVSKGAAFYRKTAAELVQRYPEVIEPLRDGRLCISSVVELAKVITPENRGEVLPRFFHTSKQEAKAVAAELRPSEAPPHRDVVTQARPSVAQRTAPSARVTTPPADVARPVQPVELSCAAQPSAPVAVSPLPRPVAPDTIDRSRPSCLASTSPSPAAFSPSSPRRGMRSRTATRAPAPRRCWRPRSTCSSPRTTRRRAS